MLADIVRFFAAAFLTQVSFLIIFAALLYVLFQFQSEAPLFLIFIFYILYGWPLFFVGLGGFAIIFSAPVMLVTYSLLFAVIKIRMRDRYRGA